MIVYAVIAMGDNARLEDKDEMIANARALGDAIQDTFRVQYGELGKVKVHVIEDNSTNLRITNYLAEKLTGEPLIPGIGRSLKDEQRDMVEAHAQGLHSEHPREFCPECQAVPHG